MRACVSSVSVNTQHGIIHYLWGGCQETYQQTFQVNGGPGISDRFLQLFQPGFHPPLCAQRHACGDGDRCAYEERFEIHTFTPTLSLHVNALCSWSMAVGLAEQPWDHSPPNLPPTRVHNENIPKANGIPGKKKLFPKSLASLNWRTWVFPTAVTLSFHHHVNGGRPFPTMRQSLNLETSAAAATGNSSRAFSWIFPSGLLAARESSALFLSEKSPFPFSPFSDVRRPSVP